ncbi:GPS-CTERM domain-containing protein [Nocardia alni]|uniref:GPS-CTERM domain-containing protein n=1 Tax=Nocardia alni TaxID=2815723 RepID=UPI001C23C12A|nr:GPS-CTERM domain-containing protein [Nocardia alni]
MIRSAALLSALAAAIVLAPTASAAPAATLRVSAVTDLAEGQRITVNGSEFRPGLAAVAVGLCKKGYTNGLHDCDLDGGASFVNISDDGTFPTVTLTARSHFQDIDCLRQQCVIAAAPLPGTEPPALLTANSAQIAIGFAGSQLPSTAVAPSATAQQSNTDTRGPSTTLWSITAALLLIVTAVTLVDRRRKPRRNP